MQRSSGCYIKSFAADHFNLCLNLEYEVCSCSALDHFGDNFVLVAAHS